MSSWVKWVHCQPKFSAVSCLSLATVSRSENRGTPLKIGNKRLQLLQPNSPVMISASCVSLTDSESLPAQDGHTRYVRSFSFKGGIKWVLKFCRSRIDYSRKMGLWGLGLWTWFLVAGISKPKGQKVKSSSHTRRRCAW